MDIAKAYIRDRSMDLKEVAFLLGFAELSTFFTIVQEMDGTSAITIQESCLKGIILEQKKSCFISLKKEKQDFQ